MRLSPPSRTPPGAPCGSPRDPARLPAPDAARGAPSRMRMGQQGQRGDRGAVTGAAHTVSRPRRCAWTWGDRWGRSRRGAGRCTWHVAGARAPPPLRQEPPGLLLDGRITLAHPCFNARSVEDGHHPWAPGKALSSSLNLSQFVARKYWLRCWVSLRRFCANLVQKGEPHRDTGLYA